jgi:ribosomal protein S12 methylthiotransferase accessory factor YcaO
LIVTSAIPFDFLLASALFMAEEDGEGWDPEGEEQILPEGLLEEQGAAKTKDAQTSKKTPS